MELEGKAGIEKMKADREEEGWDLATTSTILHEGCGEEEAEEVIAERRKG